MAQVRGGVIVARALKAAGVDTVFYLIGGPMQEVMWGCADLGMRLVDVRHEQAAAMMAHAYSRVSGKTGVCITGAGADTGNAANGIAVAAAFCDPLVAIGGSATMGSREMGSFEEMDQVSLMRPITKKSWQIQTLDRIPDFVDMAFRHAKAGCPGPVYLDLPAEMLFGNVDEDKVKIISSSGEVGRPMGDERLVEKAVSILEKADRPIVISGSGALWSEAGPELQEFVERNQIPFFTTPVGRGIIPEDHPLCFPGARSFAWEKADVALVIGTRANWIVQYLRPPRFSKDLKIIMVNIDPTEIGHNRPVDVGIAGDAKAVLRQMQACGNKPTGGSEPRRSWIETLRKINTEREERMLPLMNSDESPIHPLRLCKEIRDILARDAVLSVDGNEIMNFARQSIPTYCPRHRLNIGPSGCIGTGVPFGIGAKVAKPDNQVLILSGDGGFGMHAVEIDTAVRNKINVVTVISNNGGWAGLPTMWPAGRELGFTRYDRMAEGLGACGYYVEEPNEIRPALEKAFASGKPAVVNVITSATKATTQLFSSERMSGLAGRPPFGQAPSPGAKIRV